MSAFTHHSQNYRYGSAHQLYQPGGGGSNFDQQAEDVNDTERRFVEALLPYVKYPSYTWIKLQHEKREAKRSEKSERGEKYAATTPGYERYRPPPYDQATDFMADRKLRMGIEDEPIARKKSWATRLLGKLRKDIVPEHRDHFIRSVTGTLGTTSPQCVMTNGDVRQRMRRIDCFRQSNKVWRLDLVTLVLFRGLPLESTDGERLGKSCNRDVCIQPYHLHLNVKEIDMILAKVLAGNPRDDLLQYELKSTYDMEELWQKHNVLLSSAEGFNQPHHVYTQDAMSVSPPTSTVGGAHCSSSAPIPVMQARKRPQQASFDEDDMDAASDGRSGMAQSFDSSHVGSLDYHSLSSPPKVKPEIGCSPPATAFALLRQSASTGGPLPQQMAVSATPPSSGQFHRDSMLHGQNSVSPASTSVESSSGFGSQFFAAGQAQQLQQQTQQRLPVINQPYFSNYYQPQGVSGSSLGASGSSFGQTGPSPTIEPLTNPFNADGSLAHMSSTSPASDASMWAIAGSQPNDFSSSMPPLVSSSSSRATFTHQTQDTTFLGMSEGGNGGNFTDGNSFFGRGDLFGGRPNATSMPVIASSVSASAPNSASVLSNSTEQFMSTRRWPEA